MGRISVSEAPKGPSPQDLPPGGYIAADRPARLTLAGASALELTFEGRHRARAPLLLCPLLLCMAVLPWLSVEPWSAGRALMSGASLAAAALLARWSWPRAYRLCLRRPGGAATSAPAQPLRWILEAEPEPDSPRGMYVVRVDIEGDRRWTALRNTDPQALLRQLRAVLLHWPAPVECRWGLPDPARPWSFEPPPPGPVAAGELAPNAVLQAPVCGKGLLWIMSLMTVLMLVELTFLVVSESAKLPQVHFLSVLLPAITATGLVMITLILATAHVRLSIAARVSEEVRVLGLRRPRGDVRLASIRGVYAIGALSSERWHVLIESADGPLAVPVDRSQAELVARETRLAISSAGLSPG